MSISTRRPDFTRIARRVLLAAAAVAVFLVVSPVAAAAPGDPPDTGGLQFDSGLLSPDVAAASPGVPNPAAAITAPAPAPAVAAAPTIPVATAPSEIDPTDPMCLQLGDAGPLSLDAACDSVGADIVNAAVAAVDFASDPLGWLTDKMAQGASGIMSWIADTANNATSADITADWWISAYKQAFAVAIILFGMLTLWNMVELGRGKLGPEEFGETVTYRSMGFFAGVIFGPPLTKFLIEGAGMLTNGIIAIMPGYDAGNMDAGAINDSIIGAGAGKVIGGFFVAFLLLLLVLISAMFLFVSLAVQTVVIYLGGAVFPIAFTWIINARHRGGSMKIPFLILGVIFARPLLFFLVGIGMAMARSAVVQGSDDAARNLANVVMAAVVLSIAAFAPLLLLKFAPVIPTGTAAGTGHGSAVSNPGVAQPGSLSRLQRLAHRRGSSGGGKSGSGKGGSGRGGSGRGGGGGAETPVNADAAAAGASPSGTSSSSSRRGIGGSKPPSGGEPSAAGAALVGMSSGSRPRLLDGPPTPAPTAGQRVGNAVRAASVGARNAPGRAVAGAKALPAAAGAAAKAAPGAAWKAAKKAPAAAKAAAPAAGAVAGGVASAARRVGHGVAGGADGDREW